MFLSMAFKHGNMTMIQRITFDSSVEKLEKLSIKDKTFMFIGNRTSPFIETANKLNRNKKDKKNLIAAYDLEDKGWKYCDIIG